MPYSEIDRQVVEAATNFCLGCDNLKTSMQFPRGPGEIEGGVCRVYYVGMRGMIERQKAGECGLAMVNGVSGTMTLAGFVLEEGGKATA